MIEALLVPDGGKVEGGTPLFKLRKTGGKSGFNLHFPFQPVFFFFLKTEAKHFGVVLRS